MADAAKRSPLVLLALVACTASPAPKPDPALRPEQAATREPGATSEPGAKPVHVTTSEPSAEVSPPPAPTELPCDPTGTWRIETHPWQDGCEALADETIQLSLAFVADNVGTKLAAASRPLGEAGALGRLAATAMVTQVVVPGHKCSVRWRAGGTAAGSAHVELLLHVEDGALQGLGTYWSRKDGEPCRQRLSVFGARTATEPDAEAALGPRLPAPPVAPPVPASAELTAATRAITARALLGGAPARRPRVKLAGSIVDYVAAVVGEPEDVELLEVPCGRADARCVAIVGEPCRRADEDDDCEGMYLSVVVDPRARQIDRADASGYPIESQVDIEEHLEIAP